MSYPFDCDLKFRLAVALYHQWCDGGHKEACDEIEALCRSVIEECKSEDTVYDAVNTLVSVYGYTARPAKARALLEAHLSPMKYRREASLSAGIGDGRTEFYIQDEIDKLTDALGCSIVNLVLSDDLPNDPSTWDKKIRMLETAERLYPLIYGEDLLFYHTRLSHIAWLLSTYQIAVGKTEEALASLERMAEHAVAYDRAKRHRHGEHFTSVLTDALIYPESGANFHELTEHNDAYYRLDRLASERYDGIREDARFVQVVERLQASAK